MYHSHCFCNIWCLFLKAVLVYYLNWWWCRILFALLNSVSFYLDFFFLQSGRVRGSCCFKPSTGGVVGGGFKIFLQTILKYFPDTNAVSSEHSLIHLVQLNSEYEHLDGTLINFAETHLFIVIYLHHAQCLHRAYKYSNNVHE